MTTYLEPNESEILQAQQPDEAARLDEIVAILDERGVDPQRRLALAEEGEELAERLGRRDLLARCYLSRGIAYRFLGNNRIAYDVLRLAADILGEQGDSPDLVRAQMALSSSCVHLERFSEAIELVEQSREIARRLGDRTLESSTLTVAAVTYVQFGDTDRGIACVLEAIDIDEGNGNERGAAQGYLFLSMALAEIGDHERALEYVQRSYLSFRGSGTPHERNCLRMLGEITMALGEHRKALSWYQQALDLDVMHDASSTPSMLAQIGSIHFQMGDLAKASEYLHESLAALERLDGREEVLRVLLDLARLYRAQGDEARSLATLERVRLLAEEHGDTSSLWQAHEMLAGHYEHAGDVVRALDHFKEFHRIKSASASSEATMKLGRVRAQLDLEKQVVSARLKAERMEHELDLAHRVQEGMLPASSPSIAGLDIASLCVPALEVGGDYYDFIPLGDNRLGIVIGDVAGKGLPASIHMVLVKGVLRSHAVAGASPKVVLERVNHHLYEIFRRGMFASMIYAVVDLDAMELRFASAGHNPFLLLRGGRLASPKRVGGLALGLAPAATFAKAVEEHSIQLRSGDTLLFYTDGFSEAMNRQGEEYGADRLADSAIRSASQPAAAVVEAIRYDVASFTGDVAQHDDMTIVLVGVRS